MRWNIRIIPGPGSHIHDDIRSIEQGLLFLVNFWDGMVWSKLSVQKKKFYVFQR
jgi:hypothetical protein